ncbi:hypothetical protein ABT173_24895 [Streptomyces sp. NPDC001795]|uniref:hypothetical protein n=1 Tax=unclassified Streptomyces TaxID=2593676 RepID=UPI00331F08E2
MPTRMWLLTTPRMLAGTVVLAAAVGSASVAQPVGRVVQRAARAPQPATLCAAAGTLKGQGGQTATIGLCTGSGSAVMNVSAPASCARGGTKVRFSCLTSGSWTARRGGRTVASGTLSGGTPYPGPGRYDLSGTVHVRSKPGGVDLNGTVHTTLTLTDPLRPPTHRIQVGQRTLHPRTTTTLTYTVHRDSDDGDGSARFGLIGEESSGMRVATDDSRCINPLTGRYPSGHRNMYALDCTLTDLQPGHPDTVVVRVTVKDVCSTVVSKLGYWMPQGQALFTGGMIAGPTVTCEA